MTAEWSIPDPKSKTGFQPDFVRVFVGRAVKQLHRVSQLRLGLDFLMSGHHLAFRLPLGFAQVSLCRNSCRLLSTNHALDRVPSHSDLPLMQSTTLDRFVLETDCTDQRSAAHVATRFHSSSPPFVTDSTAFLNHRRRRSTGAGRRRTYSVLSGVVSGISEHGGADLPGSVPELTGNGRYIRFDAFRPVVRSA